MEAAPPRASCPLPAPASCQADREASRFRSWPDSEAAHTHTRTHTHTHTQDEIQDLRHREAETDSNTTDRQTGDLLQLVDLFLSIIMRRRISQLRWRLGLETVDAEDV